MKRAGLIQLLSAVMILALAYGLDKWLQFQQRLAFNNTNYPPFFMWKLASGLILFVLWFALAWIVLVWTWRSILVSIILLVLGLVAFVIPFSYFFIPTMSSSLFDLPPSALTDTGILISVLSILHLFIPNRD